MWLSESCHVRPRCNRCPAPHPHALQPSSWAHPDPALLPDSRALPLPDSRPGTGTPPQAARSPLPPQVTYALPLEGGAAAPHPRSPAASRPSARPASARGDRTLPARPAAPAAITPGGWLFAKPGRAAARRPRRSSGGGARSTGRPWRGRMAPARQPRSSRTAVGAHSPCAHSQVARRPLPRRRQDTRDQAEWEGPGRPALLPRDALRAPEAGPALRWARH